MAIVIATTTCETCAGTGFCPSSDLSDPVGAVETCGCVISGICPCCAGDLVDAGDDGLECEACGYAYQ